MFSLATKALGGITVTSLMLALLSSAISPDRIAVTLFFCAFAASSLMIMGVRATTGHNDRYAVMGASSSANRDPRGSFGPVLFALGGGILVLGAALGMVAYVVGLAVLASAAMLWMIDTWREHPMSTPKLSARVSRGFSMPFVMPLAVLALIGFAAISFSRLFLSFSEATSWIIASAIALSLFLGAFVLAALPKNPSRKSFVSLLAVLFIAIGAIGVIGLVRGPVEHHGEGHSEGESKEGESKEAGTHSEGESPAEEKPAE